MKSIKLSELFDETDLDLILAYINHNEWLGLRIFLNSRKVQLEKKGVLPDYLYYWLIHHFKK